MLPVVLVEVIEKTKIMELEMDTFLEFVIVGVLMEDAYHY